MTKIITTKKALNTKIPTSIGFCPFFISPPTLFFLVLPAVDFVPGGEVSSNKAALVGFNKDGLSSVPSTVTCIMLLIEMSSFSSGEPLPLPRKEILKKKEQTGPPTF